jgi:hypothetical protein
VAKSILQNIVGGFIQKIFYLLPQGKNYSVFFVNQLRFFYILKWYQKAIASLFCEKIGRKLIKISLG